MDLCVLVVATYAYVLHFGKELATEREFSNFIDRHTVVARKIPVVMFPQDLKTCSEVIILAS